MLGLVSERLVYLPRRIVLHPEGAGLQVPFFCPRGTPVLPPEEALILHLEGEFFLGDAAQEDEEVTERVFDRPPQNWS